MKFQRFFIITTLFCYSLNYAQNSLPASGGNTSSITEVYLTQRIQLEFSKQISKELQTTIEDFEGSPYLNQTFLPGIIYDDLTGKKVDVHLRYNIYNDVFEIKYDPSSDEVFDLIKKTGYNAKLGSNKFYYKTYIDEKNNFKKGYVLVLFKTSNITLFKKHYQTLRAPKKAKVAFEIDQPARLLSYHSYFLVINGQSIYLTKSKKKIIQVFPEYQKELKAYIKKEKLSFKTDNDYIKLITYYSTL
ncbi:hypothetical protein [Aquimarina sp. 2201CG5-10]|uniref:hypothetical protein n=1 Tax=Aquimarina callyspongiae TaxID=3098150 RepID=UPI002AB5328F|nr:hypothetical protein [Aquimarina sp. 2201CG5-10]MDY8136681.1 hypothetical protein [Aquimarina sp. 2201CG5-10]